MKKEKIQSNEKKSNSKQQSKLSKSLTFLCVFSLTGTLILFIYAVIMCKLAILEVEFHGKADITVYPTSKVVEVFANHNNFLEKIFSRSKLILKKEVITSYEQLETLIDSYNLSSSTSKEKILEKFTPEFFKTNNLAFCSKGSITSQIMSVEEFENTAKITLSRSEEYDSSYIHLMFLPVDKCITNIYFDKFHEYILYESRFTYMKPIIYIYPEEETNLSVTVGYPEKFTCVYPEYNNGWNVLAKPDGTLFDTSTNKEYYSLYYECDNSKDYSNYDFSDGFVVSKDNIASFLEEKLSILGLNARESQEFIIYWLPKMQDFEYSFIRFQPTEEIDENMPLYFSENPDTLIRVFMEWKGLDKPFETNGQILEPVNRNGFTIVEWGGTVLD